MATTLEKLRVIIEGEIGPFQRKMKQVESQVRQAQSKIANSTAGMNRAMTRQTNSMTESLAGFAKLAIWGIIGKKMLDLGMYSTRMSLQVTASVNQIKRIMGESSQSFLKWVEQNANAMNMSIADATKYGSVYSNLFSSFIKDSEKLSSYTGKMLQTSAIIAQGTGRTMTDVMERIRSGLLGNTEAIEDLGIHVNVAMIESTEAFKRFSNGESWRNLDFNTQQQIRLMAILEQASAKYGNTLQQNVNGRVNLFKTLLRDVALNIGNSILPIIAAMMPVLNSLAMALKTVTAKLAEFVGLMFNKKATVKGGALGSVVDGANAANTAIGDLADTMQGVDDSSGGTADNLDDAAKSAKKAVKELLGLAGFDEITTLKLNQGDDSPGSGSGSGGGSGKDGSGNGAGNDILPEIALEDMDNKFKSIFDGWGEKLKPLLDIFSKGFNASFKVEGLERISKAFERIKVALTDIATDDRVVSAFDTMVNRTVYALGQIAGSIGTIGVGLGVWLSESIANGLERQKERIIKALVGFFTHTGGINAAVGNLSQIISESFYNVITSDGAVRIGSAISSAIMSAGSSMVYIGSGLASDVIKGFERVYRENMPKWSEAISQSLEHIAPIFESLEQAVNDFGDAFSNVYDKHLKPFIEDFFGGISRIISAIVDAYNKYINPVLQEIGEKFSEVYEAHIKPAIEKYGEAFGKLIDVLRELWNNVLAPFLEWLAEKKIAEAAGILYAVFLALIWLIERMAMTIEFFATTISGLIDFISGVFSLDWTKAWNGIKDLFLGIVGLLLAQLGIDIDALIAEFERWWESTKTIFKPVVQFFTGETFSQAWEGIKEIFSNMPGWFGQKYEELKNWLSSIPGWFGQIFHSAWNNVVNAFSNVSGFFQGIYNSIVSWFSNIGGAIGHAVSGAFRYAMNWALSSVENAINEFISMINSVIGLINNIPGVNLGRIGYVNLPRLARGGIVDSPTVAMIGEAGKEVVMPLENTGFLQTMGRVVGGAVVNALGGGLPQSAGLPSGDIVIMIGSREFGRFAIDEINKAQEQAGELLLNI